MDKDFQREIVVQNFHKNVYGSESLQSELNDKELIRNDITVCDFFPLVLKWHESFVIDDQTDSDYPFFTSNVIEEMRRDVLKYVSSFRNEDLVICLRGLFKKSEGSSDMLVQRFNWVLEEIYGILDQNFVFHYLPLCKIPYLQNFSLSIKTFYHDNATELNDAIKNLVNKLRETIGSFHVTATIKNNILNSEIVLEKTNEQAEYFFYLLRDGKVIDRQGWFKENKFKWSLEESGSYCVQGYVRNGKCKEYLFSKPLGFFNEITRKEFEKFMSVYPDSTNAQWGGEKSPFSSIKHPLRRYTYRLLASVAKKQNSAILLR